MPARTSEPSSAKAQPHDPLAPVLTRVAIYVLAFSTAAFLLFGERGLTIRLFRGQDFPLLLFGALILLLLSLRWVNWRKRPPMPRYRLIVPLFMLIVLIATWLGTWLVFGNHALSRDEILADFDSLLLAQGRAIASIPAEWRSYSVALMPQFMLPVSNDAGWLSAYLPVNAAMRAVGRLTIGAEAVNPLLACLAVVALHRIGRRLWPDEPLDSLVPVILLVASSQFLVMAMTPYAMTGHLAFNLCWLWFFLRNDRRGDIGAFAIALLATGLHQLLFHPLFAFPFVAGMWLSGQRARAGAYAAGYAAIMAFWICYWQIVLPDSAAASAAGGSGIGYLLSRVGALIEALSPSALVLTILNLLRFLAWQHLLLVPLAVIGCAGLKRGDGIARPLAASILLTIIVMLILLPWQGHGWGYRYLHGLIGSFCLLAGYGWRRIGEPHRTNVLAIGTAASLLVLLPIHLFQAHNFVRPYRDAQAMIARSDADLVLVDGSELLFAEDLVRNRPDLANQPKIMDLGSLNPQQIRQLCARYRVQTFDRRHGRLAGIPDEPSKSGALRQKLRALLSQIGCTAAVVR